MGDLALGWGILKEQSSQARGWLLWGLGGGRTQADRGTPAGKDGLTPRTFEPVCQGPGAHHAGTVQQAGLQSHLLPWSLLGCQDPRAAPLGSPLHAHRLWEGGCPGGPAFSHSLLCSQPQLEHLEGPRGNTVL